MTQIDSMYTDMIRLFGVDGLEIPMGFVKLFTNGTVYACHDAGCPEFGLFGPDNSGRFSRVTTARKAISAMDAIQPPRTQAVFFYSLGFKALDLFPIALF